ncbi:MULTISPECIES: hypothetical protein [Chelativorans]|jgi:hypothetical protein|uniref:DUF3329 domain-containing protein n=1 Tax=Chelativorans sp. (strain BNC1) TaxID=266779 RepID=Q11L67_CHESB|nr:MULTISPECIES: hypothetical protein [Chelativorans]
MHKLFDLDHPFFRPLWIRLAIIAVCLGWGVFEFLMGNPFWGTLFVGLGVYCIWGFLFAFNPDAENKAE